ncbi:hypothetical protein CC1G_00903 [Coprinopsis cinerea okayama7|uniref:MARVEL domain-containing protein n=1 Tax=Coprinopsis cinerea (strain Okayama-7 / 130 / ATCC MYA-4618 / FGSC 9003) TaxID=240176 RepID=A8N928_COPC7|nr:hypothetical protein CC1G_00903 [Coprinopsis cinerea okayama7\|eukprot:XP_001831356.1 hypothetical protein CC1G_00903 [Coprinopsis cinerea okayama7\
MVRTTSSTTAKPIGLLPIPRALHILTTGALCSILVGVGLKAVIVRRANGPSTEPIDAFLPSIILGAMGLVVTFFNLVRIATFKFRTRANWLLVEVIPGLLGWTAVTFLTGIENFSRGREGREIGKKCTAHFLAPDRPELGSKDYFVFCVAQDLCWAINLVLAINYLWGVGLWYLTRREEKRQANESAGAYPLDILEN